MVRRRIFSVRGKQACRWPILDRVSDLPATSRIQPPHRARPAVEQLGSGRGYRGFGWRGRPFFAQEAHNTVGKIQKLTLYCASPSR